MVEPKDVSGRIARNESYTHTENVVFAALAAAIGLLIAVRYIFFVAAVFAAGMGFSAFAVRSDDVNYEAARAGDPNQPGGQAPKRKSWRDLFTDAPILVFTMVVVLFNVGDSFHAAVGRPVNV